MISPKICLGGTFGAVSPQPDRVRSSSKKDCDSKVPAIELAQPHAPEWTQKEKSPGVMAHPQLF